MYLIAGSELITNNYIKELGLERLQIMPCEPLHDLKGAFSNTLTELDRHLSAPTAQSYNEVIDLRIVPTKRQSTCRETLWISPRFSTHRKKKKHQNAESEATGVNSKVSMAAAALPRPSLYIQQSSTPAPCISGIVLSS